jgi:hypothetical protein
MSNPIAIAGTNVPSGVIVTPGGAQGIQGVVGPTGATGPATPTPGISTDAGNLARNGSDSQIFVSSNRYNTVGNPTFEVDQRLAFAGITVSGYIQDRWYGWIGGAPITGSWVPTVGNVFVPGTNYCISGRFLRFTLTAQKAALAATDLVGMQQWVEGPRYRELLGGPTSISVVCRSSQAPITFGVQIRDGTNAYCLVQQATLSTANVWTLVPLPNIPVFTSSGSFSGAAGTYLNIGVCLVAGSTYTAPSLGNWVAGNFLGSPTQTNFASLPVNSTFDIGFVQYEPGPYCNDLVDLDISTNENQCRRYYQKSCNCKFGTTTTEYALIGQNRAASSTEILSNAIFQPTMAKVPTASTTGWTMAPPSIYLEGDFAVSSYGVSIYGIQSYHLAAAGSANAWCDCLGQWQADTGW